MKPQELVRIGFIKKTHGLKGEVKLLVPDSIKINMQKMERVYLNILNKPVPFFIERCIGNHKEYIVKFEDTDTIEHAQTLIGKEVLAHKKYVTDELNIAGAIIGYNVEEEDKGAIGTIIDIQSLPAGYVMIILHNQKEVLMPFHEQFVKKINKKTRTIYISLPDGLLEIYTRQ
jgi:16S rRNA processing protein RimM